MAEPEKRQPGDLLLDRYLPDADEDTRERARKALRRYALLMIRIGDRLERAQSTATDSRDLVRRHTIEMAPSEPPSL